MPSVDLINRVFGASVEKERKDLWIVSGHSRSKTKLADKLKSQSKNYSFPNLFFDNITLQTFDKVFAESFTTMSFATLGLENLKPDLLDKIFLLLPRRVVTIVIEKMSPESIGTILKWLKTYNLEVILGDSFDLKTASLFKSQVVPARVVPIQSSAPNDVIQLATETYSEKHDQPLKKQKSESSADVIIRLMAENNKLKDLLEKNAIAKDCLQWMVRAQKAEAQVAGLTKRVVELQNDNYRNSYPDLAHSIGFGLDTQIDFFNSEYGSQSSHSGIISCPEEEHALNYLQESLPKEEVVKVTSPPRLYQSSQQRQVSSRDSHFLFSPVLAPQPRYSQSNENDWEEKKSSQFIL